MIAGTGELYVTARDTGDRRVRGGDAMITEKLLHCIAHRIVELEAALRAVRAENAVLRARLVSPPKRHAVEIR